MKSLLILIAVAGLLRPVRGIERTAMFLECFELPHIYRLQIDWDCDMARYRLESMV
jgi:hypothetical protein